MSYQVPAAPYQSEYSVKKSRFIARVVPGTTREDVNVAVALARTDYPDAGHHCWAYLLGRPEDASSAGMNDDGEPAGTAGKPILNVLQHGHLGDVLVIVIRYFGGIKLGAGGLVRAYSTATAQALDEAPAYTHRDLLPFVASGDFSLEQPLRHFLTGVEGEVLGVNYSDQIELSLKLPAEAVEQLEQFCAAHGLTLAS